MSVLVIVPVFNMPHDLLDRCLDSLRAQTYERFTIAVVNDGSDLPLEVRATGKTVIFNKLHTGQADSINHVLKVYDYYYNYWCTVSGDDTVEPDYLTRLTEEIEHSIKYYASPNTEAKLERTSILEGNYMHGGALFSSALVGMLGPLDDHPLWDWDLWARIAYYNIPGVSVPDKLYNWTERAGSVSRSMSQEAVDNYRQLLKHRYGIPKTA